MTKTQEHEGVAIRSARKRAGLTQARLSEATGIDQAAISRIENGKQGITLDSLKCIAAALGIGLGELLEGAGRH